MSTLKRGRREITVEGVKYQYRIGGGFVQIWRGKEKRIVRKREVLGMTEQEYKSYRRMICETCGDATCPHSKMPLNIAITPAKMAAYLKGAYANPKA